MLSTTSENMSENRNQLQQRASASSTPNSGQQRSQSRLGRSPGEPSSKPNIRFLDQLRILPEVRPIPWRPGHELPVERSIDSPRVQQRGAILLATRGRVAETPCSHCAEGYGRFSLCITLDRWFQGACSSCIFTSKGNKCSLRHQLSGNADGRALRYHTDNPEVLESVIRHAAENPQPTKKRKKRPTESLVDNPHEDPAARKVLYSPSPESPDVDAMLQVQIAREQDDMNRSATKEKSSLVGGAYAAAPASSSPAYPNNYGRTLFPFRTASSGVAGTFQSDLGTQSTWQPQLSTTAFKGAGKQSQDPETAVIDRLPQATQKKIYGFISGLSNGIRNLQNELDSLKEALGIDVKDERDMR